MSNSSEFEQVKEVAGSMDRIFFTAEGPADESLVMEEDAMDFSTSAPLFAIFSNLWNVFQ